MPVASFLRVLRGFALSLRWESRGRLVVRRVAALVAVVITLAMAQAVEPAMAAPTPSGGSGQGTAGATRAAAVTPPGEAGASELSRPDMAGAQKLAHTAKKRVEILGERTESTATYVNADGTLSVQTFTGPRWVQRTRTVEGKPEPYWVDVDTTLVANPDGSVAPKAVTSGLVLSGGGDTVLARMTKDGVGLATAAGAFASTGLAGALPKPTLSGSTATYAEVQPGVDLTVTATRTGYESSWVIKARPSGPLNLELPVTMSGLTPSGRADGGIDFANAAGRPVMMSRAPQMWDAARDPVTQLPKRVRPVAMGLAVDSTLPAPGVAAAAVTASGAPVAVSGVPSAAEPSASVQATTPTAVASATPSDPVPSASPSPEVSPSSQVSPSSAASPSSEVSSSATSSDATASATSSEAPASVSVSPSAAATQAAPTSVTPPGVAPSVTPSAAPSAAAVVRPAGRVGLVSPRVAAPGSVPGARGGLLKRFLGVRPDPAFLADPATQFPVVVDPFWNWAETADTYVKSTSPSTSYYSDTVLVIGYDGSAKYRSYVKPPDDLVSEIGGKAVVGAYLQMFNSYSSTCGTDPNSAVNVFETSSTFGSGTTYGNKLDRRTTSPMSSTVFDPPSGRPECGGAAYQNIDITPVAQEWASGAYPVMNVEVSASDWDTLGYKRFYSGNSSSGGIPNFFITYGSYPGVPHDRSVAGGATLSTNDFVVEATVDDPDGAWVQGQLFIQDLSNGSSWVTPEEGTYCSTVESGGRTMCLWPDLKNGHTYQWRLRTVKLVGEVIVVSEYSSWRQVTIDTTAPDRATVTSTAYPAGSWNPATPAAGTFTFSSPSGDVSQFRYWFNNGTRSVVSASGGGPRTATVSLTPPIGPDTLHVQAVDAAGNTSADASYQFGAGVGVSSPRDGARTQARVGLQAVAPTAATKVTFQYKQTAASTWTTIPAEQLTLAGAAASWPVATAVDAQKASAPANVVWDVAGTLGAGVNDGAFDVQAVFTADDGRSWTTTNVPTFIMDRAAFGDSYATRELGPGSVSLLTGNYSITATDVTVPTFNGDLTIRRSFNSFAPKQAGPFGPGWVLSMGVDAADSAWSGLEDLGSFVRAVGYDGGGSYFALQGDGTYVPLAETATAGLSLKKSGSGTGTVFTVKDVDGNATTFGYSSGSGTVTAANPWRYRLDSVTQLGFNIKSSVAYNDDGTPYRFLAPTPQGDACDEEEFSPGCRRIKFYYDSSANPGRVTAIGMKTALPDWSKFSTMMACYSYDAAGRLYQAWDPRTSGTDCGTPVLPITYTYDTSTGAPNSGKIVMVASSGVAPWRINYTSGSGKDPYTGKVDTVSRTHNAANGGGTETATVRYGVPFGTPAAGQEENQPDLSAASAAAWAQKDLPVTATAVFSPGGTVSTSDLRDGEVTGIDVNGRAVNTASFSGTGQRGWKIATNEHDDDGNVVRTLMAGNRDRAVYDTAGAATALGLPADSTSVWLARVLDTTNMYSSDGTDLLESFGPYHLVSTADGSGVVGARAHVKNTYGTRLEPDADPTVDGPLHKVVKSTSGASQSPDVTVVNEFDIRKVRAAYGLPGDTTGWRFRTPVRTTVVVPGGTDVVRETVLDPWTGATRETRQPSAAGKSSDPGTRKTTYYQMAADDGGDDECVQPAWVNLVCKITAGAQPTTGGMPTLPTTRYRYDYLNRPVTVTETVNSDTGTLRTRTTTTTYENNGQGPRVARTFTTADTGTAVPAVKPIYDPATGLQTGTTTDTDPAPATGMAGTITTSYDDFARAISTTDADAATTTQTYDSAGRPWVTTWKKPDGTTLGSRTLEYGSTTEHRGMVTKVADSGFGAITGTYDADGSLQSQVFPNGLVEAYASDATGTRVDHADVRNGVTWLRDRQTSNIHGQWTTWNTDGLAQRSFTYDPAGRLITAATPRTGGDPCEKRAYTFDVNGNRTALTRTATGSNGTCAVTSTMTLTHDNADRLTSSGPAAGIVYDSWGRTKTVPAALAGSTGNGGSITGATGNLTISYYATDAVASQTQGGVTDSWTLDPAGRRRIATQAGTAKTNHYSTTSDNPAWIDEGQADHAATRYIAGLDGGTVGYHQVGDGYTTIKYYLADLHGDIKTSSKPEPAGGTPDGSTYDTDEYGNPYTSTRRYSWLGDHQRSTDALAGTILMGARLYLPTIGRFLSVDPVFGGNENAYNYPNAPLTSLDLTGEYTFEWKPIRRSWGTLYVWGECVKLKYCSLSWRIVLSGSLRGKMWGEVYGEFAVNGRRAGGGYHKELKEGSYNFHSSIGTPDVSKGRRWGQYNVSVPGRRDPVAYMQMGDYLEVTVIGSALDGSAFIFHKGGVVGYDQ